MVVVVNGRAMDVDDGATVADLIDALKLRPRNVVVERNSEPVERSSFGEVKLARGDIVEIVKPVQGG